MTSSFSELALPLVTTCGWPLFSIAFFLLQQERRLSRIQVQYDFITIIFYCLHIDWSLAIELVLLHFIPPTFFLFGHCWINISIVISVKGPTICEQKMCDRPALSTNNFRYSIIQKDETLGVDYFIIYYCVFVFSLSVLVHCLLLKFWYKPPKIDPGEESGELHSRCFLWKMPQS